MEFRAGTRTTAFSFHYEGDHRVMHVDEVGDPWTVADAGGLVAEALGTTRWVQVGALCGPTSTHTCSPSWLAAAGTCSSTRRGP